MPQQEDKITIPNPQYTSVRRALESQAADLPAELPEEAPVVPLETAMRMFQNILSTRKGQELLLGLERKNADGRYRHFGGWLLGIIKQMMAEPSHPKPREILYQDNKQYSYESLRINLHGALRYLRKAGLDEETTMFLEGITISKMKDGRGLVLFHNNSLGLTATISERPLLDIITDKKIKEAVAQESVSRSDWKQEFYDFVDNAIPGDIKKIYTPTGFNGQDRDFVGSLLEQMSTMFEYTMDDHNLTIIRKNENSSCL